MSHIRSKEELFELRKYLDKLTGEVDISTIREILDKIVPENEYGKKMVGTVVTNSKLARAEYMPNQNTINIGMSGFIKTCYESAKIICEGYDEKLIPRLEAYYRLYSLFHENEHAYQFAIAKEQIPFKYPEVKEGYKNIAERLLKKNYIIPRPIQEVKSAISFFKYQKNAYSYILERNATTEALSDIMEIVRYYGDKEIEDMLNEYYLAELLTGYERTTDGCMYDTHKGLYLMNEYKRIEKDEKMTEDERLRFGLNINKETRNKLLSKIKEVQTRL